MNTILNDEELVLRIKNTQDEGFFEEIINRYQNDVYGRAYLACNKDVDKATSLAVEIFVEIWNCIISDKYKTPISNWIHSIANRYVIWQIRNTHSI